MRYLIDRWRFYLALPRLYAKALTDLAKANAEIERLRQELKLPLYPTD
jgi:F0F1-type ATP synthase delta subunit